MLCIVVTLPLVAAIPDPGDWMLPPYTSVYVSTCQDPKIDF